MEFLRKAKASLAEVQGDLTKATASLGIDDEKKGKPKASREAPSSNSTPINTPGTSVAPSTAGAPRAKLPLAIRKNVRDIWETKQPDLENQLSSILGVPWNTDIDVPYVYTFAEDSGYSKDNPGDIIKSYVEGAIDAIEKYVDKYGEEGKSELNSLASSHTISMDITTKPSVNYTACEIVGGVLRIIFTKGNLGTNVNDSLDNLSEAVNEAGLSGNKGMDFNARSGIKAEYEPKIEAVKARIQKMLKLPIIDLEPNFEQNYAAIAAYIKNSKRRLSYRHDWQKKLGSFTLDYFAEFVEVMEDKGFGDDDMLQEGFKEAVEKNQITLRVVDKLKKGNYNEPVIETGVLYIQTTAEHWGVNVRDPAYGLIDIL